MKISIIVVATFLISLNLLSQKYYPIQQGYGVNGYNVLEGTPIEIKNNAEIKNGYHIYREYTIQDDTLITTYSKDIQYERMYINLNEYKVKISCYEDDAIVDEYRALHRGTPLLNVENAEVDSINVREIKPDIDNFWISAHRGPNSEHPFYYIIFTYSWQRFNMVALVEIIEEDNKRYFLMDSFSIRSSKKERKFIISAINDILDYN